MGGRERVATVFFSFSVHGCVYNQCNVCFPIISTSHHQRSPFLPLVHRSLLFLSIFFIASQTRSPTMHLFQHSSQTYCSSICSRYWLPPSLPTLWSAEHDHTTFHPYTQAPSSPFQTIPHSSTQIPQLHMRIVFFFLKAFLIRLYFCVLAIILLLCFLSPPFRISVPTPHHSRPAFYFSSTSTGTFLAMTFITRRLGSASDGVAALPCVLAYEDWNQKAYTPIYVYTQSLIEMCPSYQRDKIYKNMRYTFHSTERSKRRKKGTR